MEQSRPKQNEVEQKKTEPKGGEQTRKDPRKWRGSEHRNGLRIKKKKSMKRNK